MREFANQHQQAINGDLVMRLVDIGADYERMRDFVLRGFQDDKRKELYKSLQRRAYRLACDWDLSVLCSQPTGFYRDAARLTATFSPSHDDVRRMLESYVQNMAMQSLGQAVAAGNDGDATSTDDIRAKHASDLNLACKRSKSIVFVASHRSTMVAWRRGVLYLFVALANHRYQRCMHTCWSPVAEWSDRTRLS